MRMENYIINLLIVVSFSIYMIKAWFDSTLAAQILNIFLKNGNKLYTKSDVDNYLLDKPFFIYSLLTCPTCMSFHLALWSTIFVYGGRYMYEGKAQDPFQAIAIIFISASIASNFGKSNEDESDTKQEVIEIKEQKEKVVNKLTEKNEKPVAKEESKVEDLGGYLIEVDSTGNKKVVGMTDVYVNFISSVFNLDKKCNFPRCEYWRDKFKTEIETLEQQHKEKGKHCPECIKSSVRRKFYDIIKEEIESSNPNESD